MLDDIAPPDAPSADPAATPRKPRVRPHKPQITRKCKGCDIRFTTKRIDQEFHDPPCQARWWAKARLRGGTVYALLLEWRATRKMKGGRKGFISDLAHIVDQWMIEDRETAKRRVGK